MTAVIATEGGKWLRTIGYAAVITTGAWAALWPSQNFVAYGGMSVVYAYAAAMVLGGLICLYGTLRGRWDGELVGLPMVIMATASLSIILWTTLSDSLGRGTVALVATTCALLLAERWRGVRRVATLAREAARGTT